MADFSFSNFYLGSVDGCTFVSSDALGRFDVLAFAVRYERAYHGRNQVIVQNPRSFTVLARYERDEAYAAHYVTSALSAFGNGPQSDAPKKRKPRPRCPKCGGKSHRCKTGDAGCRHCDDEKCGHGWYQK